MSAADGTKDLLVAGFQSTHFVIWSDHHHCEIFRMSIGGGNRPKHLRLEDADNWVLAYLNGSKLHIIRKGLQSHERCLAQRCVVDLKNFTMPKSRVRWFALAYMVPYVFLALSSGLNSLQHVSICQRNWIEERILP